ncbi:MAG: hypothetical protein H7Y12_09160 [Sphingobacteriaceae bacterium]|nr:hypothetical protein [Cytophagaceae bacterium]
MRLFLLFSLLIALVSTTSAQSFPQSWQGTWHGTLQIHNVKGVAQTVPMAVEITPTADSLRWRFALIYGEDTAKGRRAYDLLIVDRAKGHYVTDENNGIKLDNYLLDGRLLSQFTVQGSRLISSFERRGNELIFEIISGKDTAISTSGGQKVTGEDIPPVQSFPIGTWHRAVLRR